MIDRLAATARRHVTGPEGQRIHWMEWGEGPPLVMLHGAYGGWAHFIRNIEPFIGDHRVLIPDLPGCGLSDHPPEASVASVGRGVAAGLDEILGTDAAYRVLAFSLGGAVYGQIRLVHPGRQTHLMLVAPGGIATPRAPAMRAVRHLTGDDLVEAIRFNLNSIMFADPATVCPQALRIQYEGSTLARLNVARLDWGPRLGEIIPGYDGEITAIWGDQDVFPQVEELPERPNLIRSWCPQAECHMLPGVGHWAQYEAAETVNTLLRRLLER
ncbi:alpha/beta fold hydrolase [Pseudooceanicola sp.]|uniref:alpha/beta fold hydrolase n=1 Tax=Pseudooceanicola sp. TaxID=1914328 RepID=UPI0035C6FCA4